MSATSTRFGGGSRILGGVLVACTIGYSQSASLPDVSTDLSAFDSKTVQVPANTSSFPVALTVDGPTSDGDFIHVITSNASA